MGRSGDRHATGDEPAGLVAALAAPSAKVKREYVYVVVERLGISLNDHIRLVIDATCSSNTSAYWQHNHASSGNCYPPLAHIQHEQLGLVDPSEPTAGPPGQESTPP
jgi:hypothetical protein